MVESVKLDTKEKKEILDVKQQNALAKFYDKYFELEGYYMLYFIGSVFCAVFFTFMMFVPYQEIYNESFIQSIVIVWAAYLYSAAYNNCRGNGDDKRIYDKLKYLPISENQYKLHILSKWCKKCIIIFAISLLGQSYSTWAVYHEISWINVVYTLGMGLILPMAVSVLNLFLKDKGFMCLMIIQWITIICMN